LIVGVTAGSGTAGEGAAGGVGVPDPLGAGLVVVGFSGPLLGPVIESDDDEHAANKHEQTSSVRNEFLTLFLLG
jgi:hypothetical protein